MSLSELLTVRLSKEQVRRVQEHVALGSWENESDFVRGALEREFRRLAEVSEKCSNTL